MSLRQPIEPRLDLGAALARVFRQFFRDHLVDDRERDGVDRTGEITIRHLISNTSGITDYFFGNDADGKKAASDLFNGNDEAWPLERIIERVRSLKPRFAPGQPGKVHYSDTNYELLGRIIETVTGKSTAKETMTFLKAFFTGRFFAPETIEDLKRWNRISASPGPSTD